MDFLSFQDRLSKILNVSLLIVWIVQVCDAVDLVQSQANCTQDEVFMEGNATHCSRQYLRCEFSRLNRAMCVSGYFNATMKECLPFNQHCPKYLDIDDSSLPVIRHKRQASTENESPDCSQSYDCPKEMMYEFIYPDWDNKDCDTYYKCLKGVLTSYSCKQGIYNYYNPRTFSCEEQQSLTNTCLRRWTTRLGPIH